MREIEVKAKVNDFDSIKTKLQALGCELSAPITQKDIIFLKKNTKFSEIVKDTNVLRLRNQDGKQILTLKRKQLNELDCVEREVIVDNSENMLDILEFLDFREIVRLNKTRRKCRYKEYEICLDEIEDLGNFIEVEKMSDEDGSKIQEELFDFLSSLGISKEDRVLLSYDTLAYHKKPNIVLASKSPRRKEILERNGYDITIDVSELIIFFKTI